jgi:hypothetical protein
VADAGVIENQVAAWDHMPQRFVGAELVIAP